MKLPITALLLFCSCIHRSAIASNTTSSDVDDVSEGAQENLRHRRLSLIRNGVYMVQPVHNSHWKCLDVPWSSIDNGVGLIQYTCNRWANQRFRFTLRGRYYEIKAVHSGKCLDVPSRSSANGVQIKQYNCLGTTNQRWHLNKVARRRRTYEIKATHSRKCLDVTRSSSANWASIIQYSCSGTSNQQFKLTYMSRSCEDPSDLQNRFAPSEYRRGWTPRAQFVKDKIDHCFPDTFWYSGATRPGDPPCYHCRGNAIDVWPGRSGAMPTGTQKYEGDMLADWLAHYASELGIKYVMWYHKIWIRSEAEVGWQEADEEGHLTKNHYDHIHISVDRP